MRTLALVLTMSCLWGCTVPDKEPLTGDDDGSDGSDTDPNGVPETRITSAPAEFSNAATAVFEFEADRPGARFMCMVDDEAAADCTSPYSKQLGDGTHAFSVRAISASGDADQSPAEHLWSIDTVAPITTLTEAPPANDNSEMVHFSFIANEMNVSFECSLDDADFAACRNGDEFGPVSDGAHSFAVRAKDRAGNVDASPATHAWTIDTSTPDTRLLSGPVGSVGMDSATFTFDSPDAGAGATFECSLDGSAFALCTSPVNVSGLAMGVHTFAVRVRDATANLDPTPATRTWTVDLTAPETTITDGPSGTVSMASVNISFTADEMDVTFTCSLDGATPAPCTSPFNATMLAQGAHTFSVVATDMAGHVDPSAATASWTVDTVNPTVAITSGPDADATSGPRVAFAWSASEGVVECRLDDDPTWRPCTNPFTFNAPAGAHTFYLRSTDAAENVTMIQRTWTIACAAPDATGAVGLLHFEDGAQVLANDAGGAAATLGPTDQAEGADPAFGTGRFGMGLDFTAAEGDLVAWPLALGAVSAYTFELWVFPQAASGARDVLVSGDNRLLVRMTADGTTARFTATAVDSQSALHSTTSVTYATGAWHHVVVSLAEPTLRLWVDGDRTENTDVRLGTAPALDSLRVGGNLSGSVDELWIATVATTSDEAVLGRYCPSSVTRL